MCNESVLLRSYPLSNVPVSYSLVQSLSESPLVKRNQSVREVELQLGKVRERMHELNQKKLATHDIREYARLHVQQALMLGEEFRLVKEKMRILDT